MEDYFSKENFKKYIIDKVEKAEDYTTIFQIYCFVRRIFH